MDEVRGAIRELLEASRKPYEQLTLAEKYAIRYNIIVLVEALVALCVHVAREIYDYTPRSYVDAVRYVSERLRVSRLRDLIALVRLRNLLVHRYCEIDDEKIYRSVREDFKAVEELVESITRRLLR